MRILIMLIALPWVIYSRVRESLQFLLRRHLGNPALRQECCAPLPSDYAVGLDIKRIPELSQKAELVATRSTGYSLWFCCNVCGQEWVQEHVGKGHGEYPHVVKAG